jgi:FMN reductase
VKLCVLVGNPKPNSRTLALAQELADMVSAPGDRIVSIDLADHANHVFDWPSEKMSELTETVASSDLLVVGSPTYKAAYTGLLKGFLDRYPASGLKDVCAIPLMTGADLGHSMAPEVSLRPLLVELGALVPTRGLYFTTPSMSRMTEILTDWITENATGLAQVRHAAGHRIDAGSAR